MLTFSKSDREQLASCVSGQCQIPLISSYKASRQISWSKMLHVLLVMRGRPDALQEYLLFSYTFGKAAFGLQIGWQPMHGLCLLWQVSRKALYVVKDCKTTLSKLTTRVAKLKQVLEDILADDQEMEDMYLGRRAGKP